jgi:hypothetical protein
MLSMGKEALETKVRTKILIAANPGPEADA